MDVWTMHERKQFGERLAMARDQAKMTQTEVAAIFDIKKAAVSAWEKGRNMPTIDRVAVLAAEFKVSAEWLITGAEAVWPFGPDVPPAELAALPPDLKQQAVGALRVLMLQALSRKPLGMAA
jgi:transcriptional regulator with XRE-family HTH domain